jgi:hypothetical protein
VAGLLPDRGIAVRAFARTQDHRAEQPRQPGAEAVAEDLREIADVESWARPPADRRPAEPMTELRLSPLTGLKIGHVRRGVIAAPGMARLRGQALRLWLAETR